MRMFWRRYWKFGRSSITAPNRSRIEGLGGPSGALCSHSFYKKVKVHFEWIFKKNFNYDSLYNAFFRKIGLQMYLRSFPAFLSVNWRADHKKYDWDLNDQHFPMFASNCSVFLFTRCYLLSTLTYCQHRCSPSTIEIENAFLLLYVLKWHDLSD